MTRKNPGTKKVPASILRLCKEVTAKRPRTVINHILRHGSISTEDLKNTYGYDHPPRAIRDVREAGIPLITFKIRSKTTGRMIAGYRLGHPDQIQSGRLEGRMAFPKRMKQDLIEKYGPRSALTRERFHPRYLQIDHRIPYEISGDPSDISDLDAYMLLDASAQRAKSWSCENCGNYRSGRDAGVCRQCFWAYPENYQHMAMQPIRRLYVDWVGDETEAFDRLSSLAKERNLSLQDFVKRCLRAVTTPEGASRSVDSNAEGAPES